MVNTLFQQAAALMQEKRYEEAEPLLVRIHAAVPKDPKVNYLLGIVLSHVSDHKSALNHLLDAAKYAPGQSEIHAKISEVYTSLEQYKDALAAGQKAVQLNPKLAFAQINLGDAFRFLHKADNAREAYNTAITLDPASIGGHLGLYGLETGLGNFAEAEAHLMAALKVDPVNPNVVQAALGSDRSEGYQEAAETAISLLDTQASHIRPDLRLSLALLVGKCFEKKGDLQKAFRYFDGFRSQYYNPYDLQKRQWQLEKVRDVFTTEFFETRRDFGVKTDRPVFIVGMPRSGTTMVEQILGRHPHATGIGEQIFLTDYQQKISGSEYATPALFEFAEQTDNKDYKRIGRKYLSVIDRYDRKARRIVDKMPHNFEMLWMIALLFPDAKVIHVHREPADTCSSIYTTPLERFHSYSIDQEMLGRYYGLYVEMMEHWDKVLPISIHHQSYEALVNDQETQTRALLDYVDLPWDPVCLDFQSGERPVFTFSSQQVRQPIFKSSIGRWQKYEPHIQPLLKGLGKHAPKACTKTA
jgi:tetratricopeptide (TPR) repeat protein